MAPASSDLTVRRAALLLHCKRAREQRQRLELLRAERTRAASSEAERLARDALGAQILAAERARDAAHDSLHGLAAGISDIEALMGFEKGLSRDTVAHVERVSAAKALLSRTQAASIEAFEVLRTQAHITVKWSRLAETAANRARSAREAAEEAEREEQVAETWRAS